MDRLALSTYVPYLISYNQYLPDMSMLLLEIYMRSLAKRNYSDLNEFINEVARSLTIVTLLYELLTGIMVISSENYTNAQQEKFARTIKFLI